MGHQPMTQPSLDSAPDDGWSIFDFLNAGLLGPAKAFNGLCKSMASGKQGGYAPLRRLVQPYVLRRLKTDKNVIADLPDKTEVNAYCLLSKRQAALYNQSVEEMKKAIEPLAGMERRGVVLAFLMRFKQICNHPSQWLGDGSYEAADSAKKPPPKKASVKQKAAIRMATPKNRRATTKNKRTVRGRTEEGLLVRRKRTHR
jgi:SNF2 family DNA or RNA helicase